MGILPTRAEGHKASAARTNLSLRDEGRFSSKDRPSENLVLTPRAGWGRGHQKVSSLVHHFPLPNSGTILGQKGNWPPLGMEMRLEELEPKGEGASIKGLLLVPLNPMP